MCMRACVRLCVWAWGGGVRARARLSRCLLADSRTGKSLYFDKDRPPPGALPGDAVLWLRPSALAKRPAVFSARTAECDIVQARVERGHGGGCVVSLVHAQGSLGDCWLMSALGVMGSRQGMLQGLFVRTGQENRGRYCVEFFKDGDWVMVPIDDRIPCNASEKPLYAHSADENELVRVGIRAGAAAVGRPHPPPLRSGQCL